MALQARFKLAGHLLFINRGKGTATVDGERLMLAFDDGRRMTLRFADMTLARLNKLNGLWEFRLKDGQKPIVQTTGSLFSVGPREQGRALNEAILAGVERAKAAGAAGARAARQ